MSKEQDQDNARRARAREVGLFRYGLISEALNEELSTKQRGRLVRALAAQSHPGPFGTPVRVSRATLDRWIRDSPDGDAVRDIMRVQKPGDPSSSLLRTVKYAYTPVGQLSSVSKQGVKAGQDESYGYDAAGNMVSSTVGKTTTASTFVHNRLASTSTPTDGVPGSVSSSYSYDEFGRLMSVTGAGAGAGGAELSSYTYEGFDLVVAETHGSGADAVSTASRFDPFDRVTVKAVTKGATTTRTVSGDRIPRPSGTPAYPRDLRRQTSAVSRDCRATVRPTCDRSARVGP